MELPIIPLESVGPIKFGASPEAVQQAVNSPFMTAVKNLDLPDNPTDFFDEVGFHVYYADGQCEAVELFSPAFPTLDGKPIIGQPFREVKAWLESLDPDVQPYDSGIQSRSYGLRISSSNFSEEDNPDAPIGSMLVSNRGYFDK
jgi:hypothetical protein